MSFDPHETAQEHLRNALAILTAAAYDKSDAANDYLCFAPVDLDAIEDRLEAALERIAKLEAYASEGWQRAVKEQDRRVHPTEMDGLTAYVRGTMENLRRVAPVDYVIPAAGDERPLGSEQVDSDGE